MLSDDLHRSSVDALGAPDHFSTGIRSPCRLIPDLSQDPRRYAACTAYLLGGGRLRGGEDRDESDSEVKGAFEVGLRHPTQPADDLEDRRRRPGRTVDPGVAALREDPGEVCGQTLR